MSWKGVRDMNKVIKFLSSIIIITTLFLGIGFYEVNGGMGTGNCEVIDDCEPFDRV
jgi:hypothetical protein